MIQRIFHEFVELGYSEYRIAEGLNADRIASPAGRQWRAGTVLNRLRNEVYVGTIVYNRTSSKLKTPKRHNPTEEWIRSPEAFDGLVALEQFLKAQEFSSNADKNTSPEFMFRELGMLWKKYGIFQPSLLRMRECRTIVADLRQPFWIVRHGLSAIPPADNVTTPKYGTRRDRQTDFRKC